MYETLFRRVDGTAIFLSRRQAELSVLAKLMADWRSVMDDRVLTIQEKEDARTDQVSMRYVKGKSK